jgi:hypothetical protein
MRDRSDKSLGPSAVHKCSMLTSLDAETEILAKNGKEKGL